MANITPLFLRREEASSREWQKNVRSPGIPIYDQELDQNHEITAGRT